MGTEGSGRRLTRKQFDEVIRRATDMAAREAEAGGEGGLDESEVLRIAAEVGLSERHVRRALAELEPGRPGETTALDRIFGPATVEAARVVPGTPTELAGRIDHFMVTGQLLQRVRKSEKLLQYRPAVDWISQVARTASGQSGRYYVASARGVEVRLDPVDDVRTRVALVVDPGTRNDSVGGAALGGGAGGAGAALLVAQAMPGPVDAMAVAAGVMVGGGVLYGVSRAVGLSHRRKTRDVRDEMEGILDRLESGESLEPPPPSWLSWVRRQFHGARRLLGELENMDGPDV